MNNDLAKKIKENFIGVIAKQLKADHYEPAFLREDGSFITFDDFASAELGYEVKFRPSEGKYSLKFANKFGKAVALDFKLPFFGEGGNLIADKLEVTENA